jgi:hypothetical protein
MCNAVKCQTKITMLAVDLSGGMWEYIFLDLDLLTILLISSLYPKMISTPLLGFSLMQSGINIYIT